MRGAEAGKMASALVLGLAATVALAQDKEDGKPRGLLNTWFGGQTKVDKKPAAEGNPVAAEPVRPAVVDQEKCMRAFLRRQAVCDRLRDVARQLNDTSLERQADELESRAWEVYQKQTCQLTNEGSSFESDEAVLEKRLGDKRPSAESLSRSSRSREDGVRTATLREDK
jgi:hypothetical protein